LVWWAIAYVLAFPVVDTVLRTSIHGRGSFPFALVVTAAASVAGTAVFEVVLRRFASCSTTLWRASARVAMFGGAFLAGLFVVHPGTGVVDTTEPVFRIVSAFGVVCIALSVVHHAGSEHSDRVSSKALRVLAALTRTPLWILLGIFLILAVVGIGEIVYTALGH
jgi:hypothetical protein